MFLFKIEILLNWNFILKEERMNLPVELIVKILVEYHGGYSYRNGKFMTRILAEDERRKLIERVVPHPNKHLSKWGDICINLRISENAMRTLKKQILICQNIKSSSTKIF